MCFDQQARVPTYFVWFGDFKQLDSVLVPPLDHATQVLVLLSAHSLCTRHVLTTVSSPRPVLGMFQSSGTHIHNHTINDPRQCSVVLALIQPVFVKLSHRVSVVDFSLWVFRSCSTTSRSRLLSYIGDATVFSLTLYNFDVSTSDL